MTSPNGVHHLAVATKDIKAQIEFFNEVLGFELVALFWMHGVEGAWHGFMKLDDSCYLAFVESPDIKKIEGTIGVTHAGSTGGACAAGAMQHVAFNVDSLDDLLAMRDRIRTRGITVFGPLDHGMCHSIYFAGPEDLSLEVATSAKPIDGRAWIDPEVVELAGISAEELERFRNPVAFHADERPIPQPAFNVDLPWPRGMPQELYEAIISMPDDLLTARLSENTPPVLIED